MKNQGNPTLNREKLSQLSKKELVEIILTQIETIEHLKKEIEKLTISRDLDSKISSKPPSSDLLKKSEQKKAKKKTRGTTRASRENQKRFWASRAN